MKRFHCLPILLSIALGATMALAVPPPCSEEELLAASDYALEGYVLRVECGEPFDSGACPAFEPPRGEYFPELISDCVATVIVTRTLKGTYEPGVEVEVPFQKLLQECANGEHSLPGLPLWNFRPHSKIRYYNTGPECAYSNSETLEAPFLRGDAHEDGDVDIVDAVRLLLVLFQGAEEPEDLSALDANGDESFDVSDPVYLLDYLFRGGLAPPPPFPGAGTGSEVTILYDNFPPLSGLEGAVWGFSCLLRVGEQQILLDTGADGKDLFFNMEALGIDVALTDQLVLSHNHPDHLAGLSQVLSATGPIPVHIPVTFPGSVRDQIVSYGSTPLEVMGRQEICPGLWSSGTLAGNPDEQILHLSTGKGLVVVTACAHPGIVELVDQARQKFGRIYMVIGGFHLHKSSELEVQDAIDGLKRHEVQKIAPCHCTGDRACELLQEEFGEDYIHIGAGARFSWKP